MIEGDDVAYTRDPRGFPGSSAADAETHIPRALPRRRPRNNRIGVDTRADATGILTCHKIGSDR